MRVISGKAGRKKLSAPKGRRIRPTSEKVKGALFNILGESIRGAHFLDLFAGSGDVGIEALSRGASRVVFVDQSSRSTGLIKKNLQLCGLHEGWKVIQRRVSSALTTLEEKEERFHIVFLDPPYGSPLAHDSLERIAEGDLLLEGGVVIVEHHHKSPPPETAGRLRCVRERKFGETKLSFYGRVKE